MPMAEKVTFEQNMMLEVEAVAVALV